MYVPLVRGASPCLTPLSQYGIRFENNDQAETFVHQMAEEVSRRLKSIDMRGRSLTLKVLVRDPDAPVEAPKVSSVAISPVEVC